MGNGQSTSGWRATGVKLWQSVRKAIHSERGRRYRSLVFQAYVLIALLTFAVMAAIVNTVDYFAFDLKVTQELQTDLPGWSGRILQAISWPGYATPSVIVTTVLVLLLFILGLRWEAASALFAALVSSSLNYLIKIFIRRPRPGADLVEVFHNLDSYSFPSGHTMFYTAFFGFLLFLIFILLKRSWGKTVLLVVLALMVLLVGVSRMYLGEHWASDVIAGYLLGSLALILSIRFYHWGKSRFYPNQPVAPGQHEEVS